MDSKRLREIIQECIVEVLNQDILRVCMYCELIVPSPPNPNKSHGMCKEHAIPNFVEATGQPFEVIAAKINAKPDSAFPPNTSGAKATDPLPGQ